MYSSASVGMYQVAERVEPTFMPFSSPVSSGQQSVPKAVHAAQLLCTGQVARYVVSGSRVSPELAGVKIVP